MLFTRKAPISISRYGLQAELPIQISSLSWIVLRILEDLIHWFRHQTFHCPTGKTG